MPAGAGSGIAVAVAADAAVAAVADVADAGPAAHSCTGRSNTCPRYCCSETTWKTTVPLAALCTALATRRLEPGSRKGVNCTSNPTLSCSGGRSGCRSEWWKKRSRARDVERMKPVRRVRRKPGRPRRAACSEGARKQTLYATLFSVIQSCFFQQLSSNSRCIAWEAH